MSETTTFRGFLVQALDDNEKPIGFFSVPANSEEISVAQAQDCPNNQTMVCISYEFFFFSIFLKQIFGS